MRAVVVSVFFSWSTTIAVSGATTMPSMRIVMISSISVKPLSSSAILRSRDIKPFTAHAPR